MAHLIQPPLLCGGVGMRLWLRSRKSYPKQFARITGTESLFQAAARQLSGPGFTRPVIVTSHDFRFIVTEQLAAYEIAARAVLIEPEGRNTRPRRAGRRPDTRGRGRVCTDPGRALGSCDPG